MKLTERQITIRKRFREIVLMCFWSEDRTQMWSVVADMANEFDVVFKDMKAELQELPSIRPFNGKTPITAWLAKHYPAVSNAMFSKKKTLSEVMEIWAKSKYRFAEQPYTKRSDEDKKLMADVNKKKRASRAYAELKKSIGDRWAKTDWKKVK